MVTGTHCWIETGPGPFARSEWGPLVREDAKVELLLEESAAGVDLVEVDVGSLEMALVLRPRRHRVARAPVQHAAVPERHDVACKQEVPERILVQEYSRVCRTRSRSSREHVLPRCGHKVSRTTSPHCGGSVFIQ